jgi:hypothetical protein
VNASAPGEVFVDLEGRVHRQKLEAVARGQEGQALLVGG